MVDYKNKAIYAIKLRTIENKYERVVGIIATVIVISNACQI